MAPHTRQQEREESSRLSLRTLVIASVASATAGIVTSQFWIRGTWIAAALTPVIVALVQELLHRPTQRIATALTTDRPALASGAEHVAHERVRDQLGGEAPDVAATERRAREEAASSARAASEAPVRVYRGGRRGTSRRRLALGAVVVTGLLAFAVAAAALTIPELITGHSLGKGDRTTTLFGGGKSRKSEQNAPPAQTETAPRAQPPRQQSTEPQQDTGQQKPGQTTTQPGPGTSPGDQGGGQPAPSRTTPSP